MKTIPTLFIATTLMLFTGLAIARDLGPVEALKLRDAGIILPFEKLDAAAKSKHPDAAITDAELEEEYGKHIYQVELRDPNGIEWDVEVDAASGQVLKDHQDT